MTQYIDKAAVVAEIEKLQLSTMNEDKNFLSPYHEGIFDGLSKIENFIYSLEGKEADLEKELGTLDSLLYDLDRVSVKGTTSYLTVEDVKDIAKRFYELGLVQNGE